MSTQSINPIDYKDLYLQYSWFKNTFPPVVQQSGDEFFLPGLRFELIGVSKNINPLMDNESWFVTKIRVDKQHDVFFRISEQSVSIILDNALGKVSKKFDLNKMTDLEAKIITAFNDYLYNATAKLLCEPPVALKRTNFDIIHLSLIVKDVEEGTAAKFIISIPEVLLKPEAIPPGEPKFSHSDFSKSLIDVTLKVGTTKFSVYELKNLDIGDIVVCENSNIKKMTVKFKDYEKAVNLEPNLGLIMPYDENNNGGNNMSNTNLWDSIEVEMLAQFDSVKISLGDLKTIEVGQVVDLTSIYDNKVTLSVEGKPIAKGELVIVNDRYGVKVDELVAKSGKGAAVAQTEDFAAPEDFDTGESFTPAPAAAEEEEFDYSDFELEDEDI